MVLSCVVNREWTTPPSCLEIPTPSVCTAGGEWVFDERSWSLAGTASAAALPRKQQCACMAWNGVGSWTSLLFRAKQWWKLKNSVCNYQFGVTFILRIRTRKITGCFGKLYLCWPWSIRYLALLRAQGRWGLYVALFLNGDSKDKWPAWCFCRDTLCTNHVSLTLRWRLLALCGFWPSLVSMGLGKVILKLESTVLGPGNLLSASDWNLVSGL